MFNKSMFMAAAFVIFGSVANAATVPQEPWNFKVSDVANVVFPMDDPDDGKVIDPKFAQYQEDEFSIEDRDNRIRKAFESYNEALRGVVWDDPAITRIARYHSIPPHVCEGPAGAHNPHCQPIGTNVPVPASMFLLPFGLIGLYGMSRKSR